MKEKHILSGKMKIPADYDLQYPHNQVEVVSHFLTKSCVHRYLCPLYPTANRSNKVSVITANNYNAIVIVIY